MGSVNKICMLSLGCHYKDNSEWNPRKASATFRKIATQGTHEKGLKRTSKITQLEAQHRTEKESEITKRKQRCNQSSCSGTFTQKRSNAIRIHLTTQWSKNKQKRHDCSDHGQITDTT